MHAGPTPEPIADARPSGPPVRAVWFDVGEVLLDETRVWAGWADWLGVPRHTFSAVFGARIAAGAEVLDVLRDFRPGLDVDRERAARAAAGAAHVLSEADLYPDARRSLTRLRRAGYLVGLGGNQPAPVAEQLLALRLPADVVAASGAWGVHKPSPAFFRRLVAVIGCAPHEILHVGDRLDNDVVAAASAGLRTALVRRGPWGRLQTPAEVVAAAPDVVVGDLDELTGLLDGAAPPLDRG